MTSKNLLDREEFGFYFIEVGASKAYSDFVSFGVVLCNSQFVLVKRILRDSAVSCNCSITVTVSDLACWSADLSSSVGEYSSPVTTIGELYSRMIA